MLNCYMCDSSEWTTTGICSTCSEIRKIIACYDGEQVLATLQRVYLRDTDKCEKKTELEKVVTRSTQKKD